MITLLFKQKKTDLPKESRSVFLSFFERVARTSTAKRIYKYNFLIINQFYDFRTFFSTIFYNSYSKGFGEILSFGIGISPTLELAIKPLEEALKIVRDSKFRTTIHSDQGWHYQHNKWIKTLKDNKAFQSMSRKGNCLDNSPMENFFGLLKQEMYYGEPRCSFEELKKRIEEYILYYNNKRIKQK